MRAVQLFEQLFEQFALGCHLCQKFWLGDSLNHILGDMSHHQSTGKGAAVIALVQRGGNFFAHQDGAHRQSTRQWLGSRQNIRRNCIAICSTIRFVSPKSSRAPHTALDFIVDEQCIVLVCQRAQALEKFIAGNINATFALNRFNNDGTDVVVHFGCGVGEIVVFGDAHTGH